VPVPATGVPSGERLLQGGMSLSQVAKAALALTPVAAALSVSKLALSWYQSAEKLTPGHPGARERQLLFRLVLEMPPCRAGASHDGTRPHRHGLNLQGTHSIHIRELTRRHARVYSSNTKTGHASHIVRGCWSEWLTWHLCQLAVTLVTPVCAVPLCPYDLPPSSPLQPTLAIAQEGLLVPALELKHSDQGTRSC
jgi:hypothetical protein